MRVESWADKLDALLFSRRDTPFSWGDNDCCMFAADCVLEIMGYDPASDLRGKYSTRGQAFRVLRRIFGGGVAQVMEVKAIKYNWCEINTLCASRGDVATVVAPDGHQSLAVIDLSGRYLAFPGDTGLIRVPLSHALRAWGIN